MLRRWAGGWRVESRIRIRIGWMAEQHLLGFAPLVARAWSHQKISGFRTKKHKKISLLSKLQPRQSAIKQYCNNQKKKRVLYVGEYEIFSFAVIVILILFVSIYNPMSSSQYSKHRKCIWSDPSLHACFAFFSSSGGSLLGSPP